MLKLRFPVSYFAPDDGTATINRRRCRRLQLQRPVLGDRANPLQVQQLQRGKGRKRRQRGLRKSEFKEINTD